ncbi:MAG: sulfatase [Roseibacillus sp.]
MSPSRLALAFLLLGTAAAYPQDQRTQSARPNVLFLAVDDMNDWVGFLGGYPGKVHTPSLDRLAARGTAFTNAHTAAPVCCPSRAAVLSGLLPTTSGIYNNQHWWKPNHPNLRTIPLHFRENGYRTIGAGKIYHHTAGNNPPNQWDDYHRLVFNDNAWIRSAPLYPWTTSQPTPGEFPYAGIKLYSGEADWGVLPLEESQYDDAVTADYAINFLNTELPTPKTPFFLACGIFHPHMPWYIPQRFLDLYPLDQVVVPENKPNDLADVPAPGRKLALRKAEDLARIRKADKWQTAVRHYLASISFADAQVGRVLDTLDKSPAARNTIIVLWSDHGWHLGEKGHWHKRTLWEEATRVPFIVVAPGVGQAAQRCNQAVSLIDIYPTLIELCDLPAVDNLDGLSLAPWMRDPNKKRARPAVIIEEAGHVAIRTGRYRYIRYKNGEEELYDHETDPNEWNNLVALEGREDGAVLGKHGYAHLVRQLAKWIPAAPAKPALTKRAFQFDPNTYTFTNKKTGQLTQGK